MASYPSGATADTALFPVVASTTFNNTGTTTNFNLPQSVTIKAETVAVVDGVTQSVDEYTLTNSGATINFATAPSATTLLLKTINIPERLKVNRSVQTPASVDYSNTATVLNNSNTFLVNGNTVSFSTPSGQEVTSTDELFVYISGIQQSANSYTFPSVVYGNAGIDIGDNVATQLLLNFDGSDAATSTTDASIYAHPFTFQGDAKLDTAHKKFGTASLQLDGTGDYINTRPTVNEFKLDDDNFTVEFFSNVGGAATAANATMLSRYQDSTNYYVLRHVGANSNVGFVYKSGDTSVELYGGNCNGGVFYHVALSYSKDDTNLRLYVNNVKVAHKAFTTTNNVAGDLEIGRFGSVNQNFTGHIDALRFSDAALYRAAGLQPANTAPTVIGGAPLGSIQDDTLSIRSFSATVETVDRFTSMTDKKPDKGFVIDRTFDVSTFESQSGYEKRRLMSRRPRRSFTLNYTNLSGVEKKAIDDFYIARNGTFESFDFDLTHLNESGTAICKFANPLKVTHVLSAGSNLRDNFFSVSFNLQEVFD